MYLFIDYGCAEKRLVTTDILKLYCHPRKNDISDGQKALWQLMGIEASFNKHKQVKTSWPPLPSSSAKDSSCPDGRYKVYAGIQWFFGATSANLLYERTYGKPKGRLVSKQLVLSRMFFPNDMWKV